MNEPIATRIAEVTPKPEWGAPIIHEQRPLRILVCSLISIPAKDRTLPAWEFLRAQGHTVIVEHPESVPTSERPDALIVMGVTIQDEGFAALKRFPGVPLFSYQWDTYQWVWTPGKEGKEQAYHPSRGQEYDYIRWGELLHRSAEVWVPSTCTGKRCEQWWNVNHWHVIKSACPWWQWPADDVKDGGYALCTLRHLPDPWDTMFEECCTEIGIPFRRTDHELPYEEYQRVVANCRFFVNHYFEASTGGLTQLEAYYHGKPILCSDSEYNGARDYMGDRASYFRFGDREDFKQALRQMHDNPPVLDAAECREWIEANYSDTRMVTEMVERMRRHV